MLGTTDLRDGRWHHVAAVAVKDGDGTSVLLYVDGVLEAVKRNSIDRMETATRSGVSEKVRFGHQIYWEDFFMRGALDEVYVFESALSGDEIRMLMSGQIPRGARVEE